MKKKIEDVLLDMGIPASIKGFKYIVDAVLVMSSEEWQKKPRYAILYKKIAEINETDEKRVERAIRFASFESARKHEKNDIVNHYIGYINCDNSSLLSMLRLRIIQEMEE